MIIVVNGKETDIPSGMSLLEFLDARGMSPDTLVVERNQEIVPGSAFGETRLVEGDRLEILRFVGGG